MDDRHYEASPLARMSTMAVAAALVALFFGGPGLNPADPASARGGDPALSDVVATAPGGTSKVDTGPASVTAQGNR